MMTDHYTIGGLARAAGVPTSTIRYYERRGLLMPKGRTRARYRAYGGPELDRLRFIQAHQRSGLTLKDIAQILEVAEGRSAPLEPVQCIIAQRLAEIERTLRELRRARPLLRASLVLCKQAARDRSTTVACPGSSHRRRRPNRA
jgi:DNA-binding transcriptional MerR regulator